MTRLLTRHIATMTELREPHKVVARAGGKPVAILKNSAVIAYFITIEFVENGGDPFQTMDAVIDALKSSSNTPKPCPRLRSDRSVARQDGLNQPCALYCRADKIREQGVRREGFGFQLRVKLHADKSRVIFHLDNLRQVAVG